MEIDFTPEGRLAIVALLSARAMGTLNGLYAPAQLFELLETIHLVAYRSEAFLVANKVQIQKLLDEVRLNP